MEAPLEETCSQAEPGSASCVQRFDDSLNSAIRTTYRISLRSSSLREPRYPSTGVVCGCRFQRGRTERTPRKRLSSPAVGRTRRTRVTQGGHATDTARAALASDADPDAEATGTEDAATRSAHGTPREGRHAEGLLHSLPLARGSRDDPKTRTVRKGAGGKTGNDPSAGSPTETLLRLLLPLNDKVWTASRRITAGEPAALRQSGGLTGSFNR